MATNDRFGSESAYRPQPLKAHFQGSAVESGSNFRFRGLSGPHQGRVGTGDSSHKETFLHRHETPLCDT